MGILFQELLFPFGMVQLSPDTRLTGWDGCSGYHYTDTIVYGFSHTHLSGTGVSDYGDILLMPTTGEVFFNNGADGEPGYSSPFNKENEVAHPGYYKVDLEESGVKVELTTTKRAGFHKYHFPETKEANVVLDLVHRDKVTDAFLSVVNKTTVEGFRHSDAWARDQQVYFVIEFSKPFGQWGIADEKRDIRLDSLRGDHIKAFFRFDASDSEPLLARVGISAVSIEGARKNLNQEIAHWDFEKTKSEAEAEWENILKKIEVKGGDDDRKTVFYTALYHNYIAPNLYSDVDGQYRGMDRKVHKITNGEHYTVFSLWDTYRATHPLYTILEEKRTNDFINTFLRQYDEGGILPIWELAGNYTGCMIGYHAIPVIADAYAKGIRDYDVEKAFEAMKHSAMQDHLGLETYKTWGFVGSERESESVSKTLEYAYDDWCIAQMAKELGKADDYKTFIRRAQYYKNVYDPSTRFMRARSDHQWFGPFDPAEVNFHYTEANSWQYSFYVPQDVSGLVELVGGDEAFENHLDGLFTAPEATTGREQPDITGLIGQYAHGNEPSHHMAYLYNYVGKPVKTQALVHQIMNELYSNAPDGLSGNEDCGQMSAWLVFSAMGFYPVTPGSVDYVIGSPWFEEIVINHDNGKSFAVKAENLNKNNIFIQSALLNGEDHNQSFLTHSAIMEGGELILQMGNDEASKWGTDKSSRPVSEITDESIIVTPYIVTETTSFVDSAIVEIGGVSKEGERIFYSLKSPGKPVSESIYEGPFTLKSDAILKTFIQNANGLKSPEISVSFKKIPGGRTIELKTQYANQYNAGGNNGLIDFKRGGDDFRTGGWQGYEGIDLDAVVDLGKSKSVRQASLSCLQDENSWIFMPEKVIFYTGNEKDNLSEAGVVINTIDPRQTGTILKNFSVPIGKKTRFIGVKAVNRKTCPEWHKGAGGKSWVFVDEIIIE